MNLLGSANYDPAAAVSKATSSLLALTALDTTNLRLAITVPAHGKVLFRLKCAITGAATLPGILLGVLNSATVLGRLSPQMFSGTQDRATQNTYCEAEFIATGLAAGAMNVDAAYAVQVVVASTNIKYGGPNNNSGANAWGGFVFEAWDPQPCPTNFTLQSIDANGRVDVIKIAGTTQTARDLGASVLLSSGTGTGQLDFTSGVVKANATQWLGGTIPAVNVTGVPIVDDKYLLGTIYSTPATAGIQDINVKNIANAAVSTSTAQLGVNVVNNAGSAITAAAGIQEVKVASIAANAITATAINADAITAAKIADGAIDAATFAAGAINAAAIAADAITDAKVAGDVTIASVTGAVGSVTGAVGSVTGAVGSVATGGIAAASFAAGAINAAAIAADAIGASELAADAATEIGAAVWAATTRILTANTNLNDPTAATIASAVRTELATELARVDVATSTRLATAGYTAPDNSTITAIAGYVDTEVAAIKAKTDQLVFTIPNQIDVNVVDWKGAAAPAMTGDAFARLGAPAGASVSADIAAVKAVDDAVKAKTDNLPASPAAVGSAMTLTGAYDAAKTAATQTSVDDLPTNSELATALAGADDATLAAIAALNNISTANIRTELATELGRIDVATSTRLPTSGYSAPDNADILLIKAKTDNLPGDPADASDIAGAFTVVANAISSLNNLSQAGVRTAVGLASANLDIQLAALATGVDDLPTNAELATALSGADDTTLTAIAALSIPTAVAIANEVQTRTLLANVKQVNSVVIQGDGAATPWGP